MPDISLKACQKFWSDYQDPQVYKVTTFMESIEDWTVDTEVDDALENALDVLGKSLDAVGKVEINNPQDLIESISHLKISRLLRILQAIDISNPGSASKVLAKAEEIAKTSTSAATFLHRNVIFERLRLLSRIFSTERIQAIQEAIEGN